jgi:hypothetical protein
MYEVSEAVQIVESAAGANANIIHGVVYNDEMEGEIMVTVVATGFNKDKENNIKEENNQAERRMNQESKTSFLSAKTMDSGPKGVTQLKNYDEPTFLRNKGEAKEVVNSKLGNAFESKRMELHNGNKVVKTVEDKVIEKIKEDNYSMYERPAFIRKMMQE